MLCAAALLATLEASSKQEGLLDKLFGVDCYSRALISIKRDCR
jgi:hypothetical protein